MIGAQSRGKTRQSEVVIPDELHQAVGNEAVERARSLDRVDLPRLLQALAGHGTVGLAQDGHQRPSSLPVGACEALHPPGRP